nr:unnamed protein product [Digitaria exilis]
MACTASYAQVPHFGNNLCKRLIHVKDPGDLLRRAGAHGHGIPKAENLHNASFGGLKEALLHKVIGRGEHLVTEAALTSEQDADDRLDPVHPLLHLVVEQLPLDALHLVDAEALDAEHGEVLIEQIASDAAVGVGELSGVARARHPVGDGAQLVDGLWAHGVEHLVLEGVGRQCGAAGGLRPGGGAVQAVRRGGVELGGGVEVVHGLEREAPEREEEPRGVDRDGVADHEVAELLLEPRHGELDGDPRARAAGPAARVVVDGDVDGGEVLRDVFVGGLEDERLRGGVPELDELLGSVEGGGGGGDGGDLGGGAGGGRVRGGEEEVVVGDGGEAVVEAGEDADHVGGGVLVGGEGLDDVLRRGEDLVAAASGGGGGVLRLGRRGRRGRHRRRPAGRLGRGVGNFWSRAAERERKGKWLGCYAVVADASAAAAFV